MVRYQFTLNYNLKHFENHELWSEIVILQNETCGFPFLGIHCSRVKLPAEFIVIAKNCEREKLENGGDDVTVSITKNGVQDFIKFVSQK